MPVSRDHCVVDSAPLVGMIQDFVTSWNSSRSANRTGTSFRSALDRRAAPSVADARQREQVGPLAWLSQQTAQADPAGVGVPVSTIENLTKRDRDGNPRYKTTELRVADPLVTVMNRPEAWHDGTLTIRPNPLVSAEKRARCCSGSS